VLGYEPCDILPHGSPLLWFHRASRNFDPRVTTPTAARVADPLGAISLSSTDPPFGVIMVQAVYLRNIHRFGAEAVINPLSMNAFSNVSRVPTVST